eukprot:5864935-Amphidinium_carterae.2
MGKLSGTKFQSPRMKICRLPKAATAAKISRRLRVALLQRARDGEPICRAPSEFCAPFFGAVGLVCKARPALHWASRRFPGRGERGVVSQLIS